MMHRERMKPKYALEDYIYEMESRSLEPSAEPDDLDIYAQLQQKEKDLILAAELGKALLEKNEELSRQNERIAEDYSQKLERLEQDRHSLRRKLQTIQSDYDARVLELQTDLREVSGKLDGRETALRQTEREKTLLLTELTEQNQRLSVQLKESSRAEEQLTVQLQGLRDQCNLKKSSLQDHVTSLEMLRDEIHMMSDKKSDLERRLAALLKEREALSSALEEASDRIVMLEQQARQHDLQLKQSHREVEQLQEANGSLGERLDAVSSGSPTAPGHRSLLREMECDESSDSEQPLLPRQDGQEKELRDGTLAAYHQLRSLCETIRHQRGDSVGSESECMSVEDISTANFKVTLLAEVVSELSALVQDSGPHRVSLSGLDLELELEAELHRARESLDRAKRQLESHTEELKRRAEQVMELTSKLTVREAELAGVAEERDRARQDIAETGLARDEVVRGAREARDSAVSRKNNVEVELARTRIDVLQANSQLMEAIQQKVELSQQLEQWQMDMQSLLDEQMKRKLTSQEKRSRRSASSGYDSASSNGSASGDRKKGGLFGLFHR